MDCYEVLDAELTRLVPYRDEYDPETGYTGLDAAAESASEVAAEFANEVALYGDAGPGMAAPAAEARRLLSLLDRMARCPVYGPPRPATINGWCTECLALGEWCDACMTEEPF